MTTDSRRLDGNAAAGRLADVFAFDATVVQTRCGTCGTRAPLGQYHLYADAPGMVVRCPACETVVLRVAQTPGHTWLDLGGAVTLDIAE